MRIFRWTKPATSAIRSLDQLQLCYLSVGDITDALLDPNSTVWPYPFTEQDWEQTPPAVQAYRHTLCDEMDTSKGVEHMEARLKQHSPHHPSAVIGFFLQETLVSHGIKGIAKRRGQSGSCGSSPGALIAHNHSELVACIVCVWQLQQTLTRRSRGGRDSYHDHTPGYVVTQLCYVTFSDSYKAT